MFVIGQADRLASNEYSATNVLATLVYRYSIATRDVLLQQLLSIFPYKTLYGGYIAQRSDCLNSYSFLLFQT